MNPYSKRQRDLNKLLISLKSEGRERLGRVAFELFIHGEEAAATAEMPCSDIGFPDSATDLGREFRYSEPEFHISDKVIGALLAGLDKHKALNKPLWLELNPPSCSLTLAPWERLFQRLGMSLPRLSFFQTGGAIPRGDWLDLVLCASAPVAKGTMPLPELISALTGRILDAMPGDVTIHVFTDQDSYHMLKQNLANQVENFGERGIRLYDPATAADYEPAERSRELRDEPRKVLNPWLAWMTDSLGGRPVDAVHFLCHGLIYLDQGALALAESPCINEDQKLARFVGVRQLNAFLDRTGAYTLALTSPPHNFSVLGLRVLCEEVARSRPGVALLHEYWLDHEFKDLDATYRVLYGDNNLPPRTSAVSIYCTPATFDKGDVMRSAVGETEWRGMPEAEKDEGVWLASGRRWIERTASQLGEAADRPEGQTATTEGIEDALKFVTDVLERHRTKRQRPGAKNKL